MFHTKKKHTEIIFWTRKKQKQSHYRPWEFQEVKDSKFEDKKHIKVVSLSALRTGRLYPLGKIPVALSC